MDAARSAEMENKEREKALGHDGDEEALRKKRALNADAMPWFPKSQREDTAKKTNPTPPEGTDGLEMGYAQSKARKGDQSVETKQYLQLQREEEVIFKALEADRKARSQLTDADVQSRTVHIIGFDSATTEEMFLAKMSVHGAIRKFQLCGDVKQPTRYGFVEYISPEAAKKAILMDGKKLGIRRLRVSLAKEGIKGGLTIAEEQQLGILTSALRRRERNQLFKDADYQRMCLPDCKLQPFIQRAKALALHTKYETVGNDSFNYANFCPMQNKEDGASPPDTPLHPLRLCTQESMAHMLQLALSYSPEPEEPEGSEDDDLLEGSSKEDETESPSP